MDTEHMHTQKLVQQAPSLHDVSFHSLTLVYFTHSTNIIKSIRNGVANVYELYIHANIHSEIVDTDNKASYLTDVLWRTEITQDAVRYS